MVEVPLGQLEHPLSAYVCANVPVPHAVHFVDPVTLLKVPGGHCLHDVMLVAPTSCENMPCPHLVHCTVPS